MIFQPGQFIKTKLTRQQRLNLGLTDPWLEITDGPFKVFRTSTGRSAYGEAEVQYDLKDRSLPGGYWAIWGDEDDFYQDNECRFLEKS